MKPMKIRSLAPRRATWRDHFLAVAREAQGQLPAASRFARGGLKPRARAMASALRARVLPGAPAA